MKQNTSGIDREQLVPCLRSGYRIEAVSLVFVPGGEEAYNFVAESIVGERFLIRLQPPSEAHDLESSLQIAAVLRDRGSIPSIVAALPTRQGALTTAIDAYQVALFPFVEGETAYVRTLPDRSFVRLGSLLAEIHGAAGAVRALRLPRETFVNPFRQPIEDTLEWASGTAPPSGPQQDDVRRLLLAEAADLTDFMDRFDEFGNQLRALDSDFVITHGDSNLDNVIVSPDGGLHLIDWGEVALGPRERDLSSYADNRLDLVLPTYFEAAGSPPLHAERFRIYQHRWCLQEIADYTTRIIFRPGEPSEDEHAWTELQPYLPLPRQELAVGHERTAALLADLSSA